MSGNVLEVRDLSVGYSSPRGRVRALRNVSLRVPADEIVGIVGESGCGKSTLLAAIIGLLDNNATIEGGAIKLEGRDLLRLSPREVRALRGDRVSIIFQNPMTTLNPVLSIGTQMCDYQHRLGLSRSEKRRRAAEMLTRVGIPDAEHRLDQYPHQFSGGMIQRISIAMALQSEPRLLIADEPTTALDATLEIQILHQLRELRRSFRCSILFVSHHLGIISEICDEVSVMYAGEVVEQGSVRDIFHDARHPYTQKLLECDPARIKRKTEHLPTIPGDIPDLVELAPGCVFADRCERAFSPCRVEIPVRRRVSDGHYACCHLETETAVDG